jgi:hypothetical protein
VGPPCLVALLRSEFVRIEGIGTWKHAKLSSLHRRGRLRSMRRCVSAGHRCREPGARADDARGDARAVRRRYHRRPDRRRLHRYVGARRPGHGAGADLLRRRRPRTVSAERRAAHAARDHQARHAVHDPRPRVGTRSSLCPNAILVMYVLPVIARGLDQGWSAALECSLWGEIHLKT